MSLLRAPKHESTIDFARHMVLIWWLTALLHDWEVLSLIPDTSKQFTWVLAKLKLLGTRTPGKGNVNGVNNKLIKKVNKEAQLWAVHLLPSKILNQKSYSGRTWPSQSPNRFTSMIWCLWNTKQQNVSASSSWLGLSAWMAYFEGLMRGSRGFDTKSNFSLSFCHLFPKLGINFHVSLTHG